MSAATAAPPPPNQQQQAAASAASGAAALARAAAAAAASGGAGGGAGAPTATTTAPGAPTTAHPQQQQHHHQPFTVRVKRWHGVATWTWGAGSGEGDVCGICRCPYDGCPPGSRFPGDDAPAVWGSCGHAFHLQCVQRWQEQQRGGAEPRCPLCRRAWEFRSA